MMKSSKNQELIAEENDNENEFARGSAQRSSVLKRQRPIGLEKQQQQNEKPFFTGSPSFKELFNNGLFVDKSLFIKDIFDAKAKNIRFCLPKGFGKTINLRMVEAFFDIPEDGPKENLKQFANYDLFDGTEIFKNEYEYLVSPHFGRHPVIHMTLATVRGKTKQIMVEKFRESLSETCKKFHYIYVALKGSDDALDIGDFNFLKGAFEGSLGEGLLHLSLHKLSGIVKRWHKGQAHGESDTVILLDEYDKPVNDLHNIDDKNEREAIMEFHGNFLNDTFKDDQNVLVAIAAGIFRTGLPNESRLDFKDCTLMDDNLNLLKNIGFTDKNITDIKEKINIDENHLQSAKHWYNGYRYGRIEDSLYIPFSITRFLNAYVEASQGISADQPLNIAKILKPYFTDDSKLEYLKRLLKAPEVAEQLNMILFSEKTATYQQSVIPTKFGRNFQRAVQSTVQSTSKSLSNLGIDIDTDIGNGKTITLQRITFAKLTQNFGLNQYNVLAKIKKGMDTVRKNPDFVPLFFSYLFQMGYLTVKKDELCVPNEEIRIYMKSLMIPYYEKVYNFSPKYGNAVTSALRELVFVEGIDRNGNDFRQKFMNLHETLVKFFTVVAPNSIRNEFFPHAMLTYLLANIYGAQEQVYDENKWALDGEQLRMDLSFHLNKTTVIVEMKAGSSGKHQKAETAFTEARYYRKLFDGRTDIDRFIFVGFSVTKDYNKAVRIAYDIVDGKVPAPKYKTPKKIVENSGGYHSHIPKNVRTYEDPSEVECTCVPH